MKDNKLEVGDVIYAEQYGKISDRLVVERVTATQAVSGNTRFKIDTNGRYVNKLGQDHRYSSPIYYLETPDLKNQYKKQLIIGVIKSTNFEKFSIESLEHIYNILKTPQP